MSAFVNAVCEECTRSELIDYLIKEMEQADADIYPPEWYYNWTRRELEAEFIKWYKYNQPIPGQIGR